jgi:hypothetical protein
MCNKIKTGINEADGKIIGREEKACRNSWFDEKCQIILEDKKRAYDKINRNSRQIEQEYKDKRKEDIKYLDTKTEYCFHQSWSEWKLLMIAMKQRNLNKRRIV